MAIKFGTDGWRDLIADNFTFENVRLCSQAVANYMKSHNIHDSGIMIGYDTRFGSKDFASAVAEVLAGNEIPVLLCDRSAPTPVVSYNLVERECGAGVVITASHNPAEWNGFKFKPAYGGSASTDIVEELESEIEIIEKSRKYTSLVLQKGLDNGLIEMINPEPAYLNHIAGMVSLNEIRSAGLNVVVDSMHGSGSKYLSMILEGGSTRVFEIRSDINPSFPGMIQPEPIEQNLSLLKSKISDVNGDVGLATDGDADRLGLVDEDSNYISTLHTFALICLHMMEGLNMKGPLVRSITMTNMINKLGEIYDVPVLDTPVGFKHLGPVMMEEDAIAAGEESGGYAFRGHILERDGILSALFILDMMVKTGKNPSELLDHLDQKVGKHFYNRIDVPFNQNQKEAIIKRVSEFAPHALAGYKVFEIDTRDGYRFVLDNGSWALIRFSGTEPLLRIYAESESQESVESLISACRDITEI